MLFTERLIKFVCIETYLCMYIWKFLYVFTNNLSFMLLLFSFGLFLQYSFSFLYTFLYCLDFHAFFGIQLQLLKKNRNFHPTHCWWENREAVTYVFKALKCCKCFYCKLFLHSIYIGLHNGLESLSGNLACHDKAEDLLGVFDCWNDPEIWLRWMDIAKDKQHHEKILSESSCWQNVLNCHYEQAG